MMNTHLHLAVPSFWILQLCDLSYLRLGSFKPGFVLLSLSLSLSACFCFVLLLGSFKLASLSLSFGFACGWLLPSF